MESSPFNPASFELPTPPPSGDDAEKKGKTKKSKETLERAENFASEESLWKRIFGEKLEKAAATDIAEVDEAEAPLESISSEEAITISDEYVEARRRELAEELQEAAEPIDASEAAANDLLLQNLQEHLRTSDESPELAIDSAYHQTVEDLETIQETEVQPDPEVDALAGEFGDDNVEISLHSTVASEAAEPTPPAASGATTLLPNSTSISSSPHAATRAAVPAGTVPSRPGGVSTSESSQYYQNPNNPLGYALLGGPVSYLVGRRRGRIKTEKKLLPVQKKLEKQVHQLHGKIAEKEASIRQLAAERVKTKQLLPERLMHLAAAERPIRQHSEAKNLAKEKLLKTPAPQKAERIGHVLINSQAAESVKTQPITKHIETLSHADLLQLSSKIIVDGTSLREIYETSLVGEKALRRLVQEHIGGGDVKKVLKRELLEREIDFERDPILRDRPNTREANVGSTTESLANLLSKAGALSGDDEAEAAVLEARAAYHESLQKQAAQRRHVADMALVTAIVVLTAVVVILLTSR